MHLVLTLVGALKTPSPWRGFSGVRRAPHLRPPMTNEQQALAEMPIWLVIVLALVGGVSGEMWRADKDGARGGCCCGA